MIFGHWTTALSWGSYNRLPKGLRDHPEKQFELISETPYHPSVQLKPVGGFWSARVTDAYHVLALREENVFTWFWIGTHDEYERLLKG